MQKDSNKTTSLELQILLYYLQVAVVEAKKQTLVRQSRHQMWRD
jgi:uncharacterized phage-associated protein